MSEVIQFLEKIATSAALMEESVWKKELNNLDISEELKLAFINKDQTEIEKILGTATNLRCALFPAKEDDDSEEQPKEEPAEKEKEEEIKKVS